MQENSVHVLPLLHNTKKLVASDKVIKGSLNILKHWAGRKTVVHSESIISFQGKFIIYKAIKEVQLQLISFVRRSSPTRAKAASFLRFLDHTVTHHSR